MDDSVMEALLQAVQSNPNDAALRLHLAELLLAAGRPSETIHHCALVLTKDPSNSKALHLLSGASQATSTITTTESSSISTHAAPAPDAFDWERVERELDGPAPAFTDPKDLQTPPTDIWDVEASTVHLSDVGGMEEAKRAIDLQFLAPLRNPELSKAFGKALGGGLLMYGPPGCGKTFIARAIAGEMGAKFINVTVADILTMYVGQSERNLHELFSVARQQAPTVIFFDEVDAIGAKRQSNAGSQSTRNVTNQLLSELDGVDSNNEGVYVIAATNRPWDLDAALRRPGRFDRTVLVLPPDQEARHAIFRHHLKNRPVTGIDLELLSKQSEGLTGADIAGVCLHATETALQSSLQLGEVRMITMNDLLTALKETRPSSGAWFSNARNVVTYANGDGQYDELKRYMKSRKLL